MKLLPQKPRYFRILLLICLLLPGAAHADPSSDPPAEAAPLPPQHWFTTRDWIDYSIIAATVGTTLGLAFAKPTSTSGIGPSLDTAHPAALLDPSYGKVIGKKYLMEGSGETVPALWLGLGVPVVAGWLAVQEGWPKNRNGRHVHTVLVGLAEATAVTLLTTSVLKFSVARLRPDFQDRIKRYYCNRSDHADVDCTGFTEGPLSADPVLNEQIWNDGRRSFPSGHASTSFAVATYAALITGGHYVWGKDATATSRAWAIPAQVAVLGLATYVSWTRVDDGRHNVSDVLTGAAIGTAIASLSYWRRFDTRGYSREGAIATSVLSMTGGPGTAGVGMSLSF